METEDQKVPREHRRQMLNRLTSWELKKELDRSRILRTDYMTAATKLDLARIRGDLIEKDLAIKQLQFLVKSVQQKLLAIPITYARRLLRKEDIKEIHSILQQGIFEVLTELEDLPYKVVDPNWLETLDEE